MNVFSERVHSRLEAREATQSKVIQAAAALFERNGFEATTIRQVAEAAGVSPGRVMAVADKRGLLVQVIDQAIQEMGDAPPADSGDTEVEQVMAVLRPFVLFFAQHIDTARAYTGILVTGNHRSTIFDQLASQLTTQLTELLGQRDDAAEAARLVHRAYLGELFVWAGSGSTDPDGVLNELERSVTFILSRRTA